VAAGPASEPLNRSADCLFPSGALLARLGASSSRARGHHLAGPVGGLKKRERAVGSELEKAAPQTSRNELGRS